MLSREPYTDEKIIYTWDDEIEIKPDELQKFTRNNDLFNEEKLLKRIILQRNIVKINLKNLFGELIIARSEGTVKYKIAPRRIFPKDTESDPERAYGAIINKVIKNLSKLITLIIKKIEDIRTTEAFKIILGELISAIDFLVYTLESLTNEIEKHLKRLFYIGPIHREKETVLGNYGSTISPNAIFKMNSHKIFKKPKITFKTDLNIMVFQTVYFLLQVANNLSTLLSREKFQELHTQVEETKNKLAYLLDSYNLWHFYSLRQLNLTKLIEDALNQQNPSYRFILEIYMDAIKLMFGDTTLMQFTNRLPYPMLSFEYIYEVWVINQIMESFLENGYKLEKVSVGCEDQLIDELSEPCKAILMFTRENKNTAYLIWEIKFKPVKEKSRYMGSIISSLGNVGARIRIKPDIIIIHQKNGKKKILIGDIKYSVNEEIPALPKLDNLYKILGYLLDLGNKSFLKGDNIEGLLIYPGTIKHMRIPVETNENNIFYLNMVSMNMTNTKFPLSQVI